MTKHIPVCKNTTGNHGQDAEEESPASEGKTETVGKPTGKAPDMRNVQDITETVMEERVVKESPPNTQEQVPWHLSTERHEVTGESSNHTGRVWQREVTKESPPDYKSDQEDKEDEESSSEVNQKADQMEFIKEFQEVMNQAIDQLLKKSARRHSRWKDKPEPHMEQGKHKETICKEAKMLPPRKNSRESDDERNSRALVETMDTDWCIQKLVRTELKGSECAQCKIEETIQYWVAEEKKAAMNYHCTLELNNSVSNKRVQQLCSQDQSQEVIDQGDRDKQTQRDEAWRISEG